MELIAQAGSSKVWFEQLEAGDEFEPPFGGQPFVAMLLVNQPDVSAAYRDQLSVALVRAGCRYALCTGYDQEAWHTSIDLAQVHGHSGGELVMTTSHPGEPLADVVEFFLQWAYFEGLQRDRFLALFLGQNLAAKQQLVDVAKAQLHSAGETDPGR